MTATTAPRFKVRYDETIRAQLKDQLGLPNIMMVPTIDKIVVNMGVGDAVSQGSLLEGAQRDLATITGQKNGSTKRIIESESIRQPSATSAMSRRISTVIGARPEAAIHSAVAWGTPPRLMKIFRSSAPRRIR